MFRAGLLLIIRRYEYYCVYVTLKDRKRSLSGKKRVALIMLIIALQFDVSTSCNEKTEINKMNKNCIVCVYTVSLSQLRNH